MSQFYVECLKKEIPGTIEDLCLDERYEFSGLSYELEEEYVSKAIEESPKNGAVEDLMGEMICDDNFKKAIAKIIRNPSQEAAYNLKAILLNLFESGENSFLGALDEAASQYEQENEVRESYKRQLYEYKDFNLVA